MISTKLNKSCTFGFVNTSYAIRLQICHARVSNARLMISASRRDSSVTRSQTAGREMTRTKQLNVSGLPWRSLGSPLQGKKCHLTSPASLMCTDKCNVEAMWRVLFFIGCLPKVWAFKSFLSVRVHFFGEFRSLRCMAFILDRFFGKQ